MEPDLFDETTLEVRQRIHNINASYLMLQLPTSKQKGSRLETQFWKIWRKQTIKKENMWFAFLFLSLHKSVQVFSHNDI